MSEEAKWYVIHTYSGYENKVASNLEKAIENQGIGDLIHEVKVPTETVIEIKNNKECKVERKIFPGYVMVKMVLNNRSWYIVRNTRGCTGFVENTATPIPLTPEEIEQFGLDKSSDGAPSIEVSYKIGDMVKIINGAFSNMTGVVKNIDTTNKVATITISMFGRETSAEIELSNLELVI